MGDKTLVNFIYSDYDRQSVNVNLNQINTYKHNFIEFK